MNWLRAIGLLFLVLVPASAKAAWYEVTTDHFVVYSEENPEALRRYAENLERFDGALRLLFDPPKAEPTTASRVTVYVLRDQAAVAKLATGRRSSIAGFYVPRAGGSVIYTPRPSMKANDFDLSGQAVLLHEYTHHFMYLNFNAAYPAWFVEGFAEFGATAEFERDGALLFGKPPTYRLYGLLGRPPALTLDEMFGPAKAKMSLAEQEDIYAQGWLLTHFLNFEPSRLGQLGKYLRAVNSGTNSTEAARTIFGDFKTLQRELAAYKKRSLQYLRLEPSLLPVGDVRLRQMSAGESSTMSVRLRSDRGVTRKQALELLPEARRAAAGHANDAAAQLVLAEAEFDAGNLAEAEAAADRALAADSRSFGAHLYKGMAMHSRASEAKNEDPALWKEVRQWYLKANRLDTTNPEPAIMFYHSHNGSPTRNAVEGLVAALKLAPHDPGLRMTVARQLVLDGEFGAARSVLAPLAFSPHGGPLAEFAATVVIAIDSQDEKVAQLFEGTPDEEGTE